MWSYVALGGVGLALLGTIFFWVRYRERQAATLREQGAIIAGLKNALATCEAARRREHHGRDDVRDALGKLRPVGDADAPGAAPPPDVPRRD